MKFLIDISDKRNEYLLKMINKNSIKAYAITNDLLLSLNKGDTVVYSPAKKFDENELKMLADGIILISGNITKEQSNLLLRKNIKHINILEDEIFAIKNTRLTAEGVLAIVLANTTKSIYELKILFIGGGKITKSTATILSKLGVKFQILCHRWHNYIECQYFCNDCIFSEDLETKLSGYDVIVNTIPANLFKSNDTSCIDQNCLFIETAPVHFFNDESKKLFNYYLAPGLPQKYCPFSAAKIIYDKIIGENK